MTRLHPLCSAFPEMLKHEFNKLKGSIKRHGQEMPIMMLDGQVLDGRHRMKACLELNVEPITQEYSGSDPLGFVMMMNLERRHLSTSQRSMVAANIANMPVGKPNSANLQNNNSRAKAAQQLNVSERSVNAAKKIQATAPSNVLKAVESGELSLNAAEKIVNSVEPEVSEVLTLAELKKAATAARHTRAHHLNNARQHADALLRSLNAAALVDGEATDAFKLAQIIRDSGRRLEQLAR